MRLGVGDEPAYRSFLIDDVLFSISQDGRINAK
jgi:hypothetical protein